MSDFHTTVPAAPVVLPLAAVAAAGTAFRLRRRSPRLLTSALLIVAYLAAVVTVTLFPLEITFGRFANQTSWWSTVNWVPVLTIDPKTFLANILLTIPLGFLLPLLGRVSTLGQAARAGLVLSLAIEGTQLLLRALVNNGRSVDVNDLLANTAGSVLGLLLLRALRRSVPSDDDSLALSASVAHPRK